MLRRIIFILLLLAVAGCGKQSPEPPQVQDFYPQDGYHGFKRGEAITITFNEPMDPASTEAAFQLLDPSGTPVEVNFKWEDGSRLLLITPANPLAYSSDDRYLNYRYLLSTDARSQKGAALNKGLYVTFSTLRTFKTTILSDANYDGYVAKSGSLYTYNNENIIRFGDDNHNVAFRGFLSFTLPTKITELVDATFKLYMVRITYPFVGQPLIEWVDLGDELDDSDFDAAPLSDTPINQGGSNWVRNTYITYSVDELVRLALEEDRERFQLRLRFSRNTNGDFRENIVFLYAREALDDPSVTEDQLSVLEISYYSP